MPLATLALTLLLIPGPASTVPQDNVIEYWEQLEAGQRHRRGGRFVQALRALESALDVRPEDPVAAAEIARAHARRQNQDLAFEWLERAAAWGLDDVDELFTGDLLQLQEDPRFSEIEAWVEENRETRWFEEAEERTADALERRLAVESARAVLARSPLHWLQGHTQWTTMIRFSPDQERVVTAGADGLVFLWDVDTAEMLGALGPISSIALDLWKNEIELSFSPDGERILILDGWTGRAELFDGRTGDFIGPLGRGIVEHASFHPRKELAATADLNGSIQFFDIFTGMRLDSPVIEAVPLRELACSPTGSFLLGLGRDRRARVFETGAGRELAILGSPDRPVWEARFSSDERRVLLVGFAGEILAWEIGTDQGLQELAGSARWARPIDAYVSRLARLLGSSYALSPSLMEEVLRSRVHYSRWNPTGRTFVCRTPQAATLRDGITGEVLAELFPAETPAPSIGLHFSPRGGRLLSVDAMADARVWDGFTGEPVAHLANFGADNLLVNWAFKPDESELVTSASVQGSGRWVKFWDLEKGVLDRVFQPIATTDLQYDPRGDRLGIPWLVPLICGPGDRVSHLSTSCYSLEVPVVAPDGSTVLSATQWWNLHSGETVRQGAELFFGHSFDTTGQRVMLGLHDRIISMVHYLRDPRATSTYDGFAGRLESWGTYDGHPELWSFPEGELVQSFPSIGTPLRVALGPQGTRALAAGYHGAGIQLLDVQSGKQIQVIKNLAQWPHIALDDNRRMETFSRDGSSVITAHEDGAIRVWNAADGTPAPTLAGPGGTKILHIERTTHRDLLAVAGQDGSVTVWNLETGHRVQQFRDHQGAVQHLAWGPGDTWLASAGADGTARLYQVDSGERGPVLTGHLAPLHHLTFDPSGQRLVTASEDHSLRLFDVATGDCRKVLEGHVAPVVSCQYAPSGERILSYGWDGTTRVWDGDGDLLLTRAEFDFSSSLAFTPEGWYLAEGDADERARIRAHGELLPLSSYRSLLHSPEKVAASLAGRRTRAATLPSAPRLEVLAPRRRETESRSFELDLLVKDRFGLKEIALVQDDRPVAREFIQRFLELEDRGRRARLVCSLRMSDGAMDTTIRVRATNVRDIRSAIRTVFVRHRPPSRDLYLLCLGVADYDDESMDLNYPVKDADDIIDHFRRQEGRLYGTVHVERAVDDEVTLPKVKRLRDQFLLQAKEEDTIVVFVAGHGVRTETNEYWFLTAAATAGDPYAGIDRSSLEQLVTWEKLHSRQRVLLIDTCHSGSAFGLRSDRRGVALFGQDQVDQIAETHREGIYILAASSDDEFAREQEGNGVFTAALLDGLAGKADRDQDGYVNIEELKLYCSDQVHDRSGGSQHPTFPRVEGGENFRLSSVGK